MSDNGRLRPDELKKVQDGWWNGREADIYLATGTANAYLAMAAACTRETGRRLEIALPAGGYRDYDTQAAMRADYFAKRWLPYNLDPTSTVAPAAPGYSNHGYGLCADIWGTGYEWTIANGHRFGFSRPYPKGDPHHFLHDGRTATAATGSAQIGAPDDMFDDDDRKTLGEIRQFLAEEKQWMGVVKMLGEVYKAVGEIRQAIYAKETDGPGNWDGLAVLVGRIDEKVAELSAAVPGAPNPFPSPDAIAEAVVNKQAERLGNG